MYLERFSAYFPFLTRNLPLERQQSLACNMPAPSMIVSPTAVWFSCASSRLPALVADSGVGLRGDAVVCKARTYFALLRFLRQQGRDASLLSPVFRLGKGPQLGGAGAGLEARGLHSPPPAQYDSGLSTQSLLP